MRRWNYTVHDPILTEMVTRWKRTDREIADEMGFDIITVGNHRKRLNLARVVRHKVTPQSYGPATPPPKELPSPLTVAKTYLGTRLVEKPSGYWLDNLPANLDRIMQECNRLRVTQGMNQITGSPRWVV